MKTKTERETGASRIGSATIEGDTVTLRFERLLQHSPQRVWDAIAKPEGLKDWLMCVEARIDGRVGGTIELVSGPPRYRSTGKILIWEPPRLLEYEWRVAPVPEMPDGEDAIFRYELVPEDGATRLLVTYRRITKRSAPGFLPGMHVFLDRLEAQLDGRPLPDWMVRFTELRAEYPAWSH
jgi:uncharacterized protein YndB with AHSA1/START domain